MTPQELKEELERRREGDIFYDVSDDFINEIVMNAEIVERLKKEIREDGGEYTIVCDGHLCSKYHHIKFSESLKSILKP